eukprot:Opistho-2@21841
MRNFVASSRRFRGIPFLLHVLIVACLVCNAVCQNTTVRVLYTGELRGHDQETLISGVYYGGLARASTWMANATASADTATFVVPIDVGSWMGTNVLDKMDEGKTTASILKTMGIQARAIGVADLQLGPDVLARSLANSSIPAILSNAVIASRHPLAPYVRRYYSYNSTSASGSTLGVGIIAALPSDSCGFGTCYDARGTVIELRDHMIYLQKAYDDMIAANPWVKFVVCILGRPPQYSTIVALAFSIRGPNAFIVVGGGYHISNVASDGISVPTAGFPLVLESATANRKAIVASALSYHYGGIFDVTVNAAGAPIKWGGGPVLLRSCDNASANVTCYANNATVLAQIMSVVAQADAYTATKIGRSLTSLPGGGIQCHFAECAVGNLIADAIRWRQRDFCEIALVSASSIRAGISAGNLTLLNASSIAVSAAVASVSIPGGVLVNVFQHAVSSIPSNASMYEAVFAQNITGRFLQVSGAKFSYDATKPPGNRLLGLQTLNIDGSYSEVTAKRVYKLCTLDFIRQGGENFAMFTGQDSVYKPYDQGPELANVIADYIAAISPLNYSATASRISARLVDTTIDLCQLDANQCLNSKTASTSNGDDATRIVSITVPIVGLVVLIGATVAVVLRARLARKIATMKSEEKRMKKQIPYEELEFGTKIGEGGSGVVFLGTWRGTPVAIKKCIDLENALRKYSSAAEGTSTFSSVIVSRTMRAKMNATQNKSRVADTIDNNSLADALDAFEEEIAIMSSLRHPNVLLYMGTSPPPNLCIVTEYMKNGALDNILRKTSVEFPWDRRCQIAEDIALGMSYLHLHQPPILHCDLKSMNILVDANWVAKVADFGLTRLKVATAVTERVGTLWWMAPEVLKGISMTEKSDVYSYGILLWELADRGTPYERVFVERGVAGDRDIEILLDDISDGFRPNIPPQAPPAFSDLMQRCWSQSESSRPSFTLVASELASRNQFDERWKAKGTKRMSTAAHVDRSTA